MKIRYGLVLAIALIVGVAGCAAGGGGGSVTDRVGGSGAGERPRNTDNTRAAESALRAASDADDDAEARMHFEIAASSAGAAIAEDERNPLGHRLAAMAALGLDDYEGAAAHFDRAGELRPLYEFEDAATRELAWIDLYQQASPLVEAGEYEAAVEFFEGANAIYPNRPEAMITLGQIYAQLREHDRALENLDRAEALIESDLILAVDSATVASWREQLADIPELRAQLLADAGRFEEAVVAYRALAAADPENMNHQRALGSTLMQMGDEEGALRVYTELMDRSGLSAQDYFAIGVGFYQARDYTQATRAFSGAARASVNDRDALEFWTRSMQLDEAYTDIPAVAQRWIELDPYSQNAYLILAQAANIEGDTETTQVAIRRIEELEVTIDQIQIQRFGAGGGVVSGSLMNKKLDQGASVTLRFTFYNPAGDAIGSVTESVTLGAQEMAEVFTVQWDSGEQIGGYGYELTIG